MKRIILVLCMLVLFLCSSSVCVNAYDNEALNSIEYTYKEQLEFSKADELQKELPKETKKSLENIGVTGADLESVSSVSPNKVFSEVLSILKNNITKPIASIGIILAIILLCALFDGLKTSFSDRPISQVMGVVSTLCVCTCMVIPIVGCVENLASTINNVANFMLLYIPVVTGIMISSGQAVSAGNYSFMMVTVGETISQISSKLLVPLLNTLLSLSIVSSISTKMNLSGICDMFNKTVKWVLEFIMAIFVFLMTIQTFVSTAADNLGTKSVKFAINSFVPIVGGALSDAYTTVYSCLRLLKSGVGAFAILACAFMFLPTIIECMIWLISLNSCAAIGDIFELKEVSGLLRSSAKVVSTMLTILICVLTILIISTGIVLTVGGGS